jgi:carbon-monoxide dehydrogenase small subunit
LIRGTLNGSSTATEIEPNELLLDVLRERFDLLGARRSCDVQVCGSCTVVLNGRAVSSCTTLALEMDGGEVRTVEGIGDRTAPHPLQQALVDRDAIQCGFCTPGFVMALYALAGERAGGPGDVDTAKIASYLSGNVCRCTGYVRILQAARDGLERAAADAGDGAARG